MDQTLTGNLSNEFIWCTLVMLSDSYIPGAAVVATSLRNVKTKYPIWCMVTDDVSSEGVEFLKTVFDRVILVPTITQMTAPMKSAKQNEIYSDWIYASYTKWNILSYELFPCKKVCFLDADCMFTENIDADIFDIGVPAMTFSNPWAKPYSTYGSNPYYNKRELKHGEIVNHKYIRAGLNNMFVGCGNMVVVSPNDYTYNLMLKTLKKSKIYGNSKCMSGADEQLICSVFLQLNSTIYNIHQQYNWFVGKKSWLLNGERPRVQQFYNKDKPWMGVTKENRDEKMRTYEDVAHWWSIADQLITPKTEKIFYQNDSNDSK